MVKLRQTFQVCQSGGGGVKRRRASRASVRAGLNLRGIPFSLIRLPAWDTLLHTHTHTTLACRTCSPTPGLQSLTQVLTRFSVFLVPLSHGDPPALLDSCTSSRNNKHTSSTRGDDECLRLGVMVGGYAPSDLVPFHSLVVYIYIPQRRGIYGTICLKTPDCVSLALEEDVSR